MPHQERQFHRKSRRRDERRLTAPPSPVVGTAQDRWMALAIAFLLAAVTLLVFWPVRQYDFVNFDDPQYVTDNPHVLGGLTWDNVAWAFQTTQADSGIRSPGCRTCSTWRFLGKALRIAHDECDFHVANTVILFCFFAK